MEYVETGAELSDCGLYRYRLWRVWNRDRPRLLWIMFNPSTANAWKDDPTIRRCIGFAKSWGFGGIEVINLYAYRTSSPKELYAYTGDRLGGGYAAGIDRAVANCTQAIAAWGAVKVNAPREWLSTWLRRGVLIPIFCLGRTKAGHPKHPLYLKSDEPRMPFLNNTGRSQSDEPNISNGPRDGDDECYGCGYQCEHCECI